jgi:hypothetical protein
METWVSSVRFDAHRQGAARFVVNGQRSGLTLTRQGAARYIVNGQRSA